MDAVSALLEETSARDLTMEAVAKRAKVGKPTLYKWWPSKSALILAMFHERAARRSELVVPGTAEENIRRKVRGIIQEFSGRFGRVLADLIAEGQSEPALLQELFERHMLPRRLAIIADVERGKAALVFNDYTRSELFI